MQQFTQRALSKHIDTHKMARLKFLVAGQLEQLARLTAASFKPLRGQQCP